MRRIGRRRFLRSLAVGSVAMASARPLRAAKEPAGRRPNVIVIVADDLGWRDVGYHGSGIRTPNLDRLAREGVVLDRFYVAPLCSPTRAGLMTGRHPLRMGIGCTVIRPWRTHAMPADERMIPEVLAEAGYARRGCFGKWHLGHSHVRHHPLNRGFTHYYGCYNGALDYFTHKREGELDWHRGHAPAREDGYTTHLISAEAVRFLRDCPADRPFFCYVPYNAPHSPWQVPKKYLAMYPNLPKKTRAYAGMVTAMDEGIGRILAVLDARGLAENTFVLFFSDNGGGIRSDNRPLRGRKGMVFEGGIRVPAVARWPGGGLRGGRKVECVMGFVDVLPTLMRIAGVADHKGKPLDGTDVLDAMRGTVRSIDRPWYAYISYGKKDRLAVLEGPWKLVYVGPRILQTANPLSEGAVHLFRIREDPCEKTDLADKHPDVVRKLLAKVKEHRSWHGKTCLLDEPPKPKDFRAPKDWILPGTPPDAMK